MTRLKEAESQNPHIHKHHIHTQERKTRLDSKSCKLAAHGIKKKQKRKEKKRSITSYNKQGVPRQFDRMCTAKLGPSL
jgi:hypothetical protein